MVNAYKQEWALVVNPTCTVIVIVVLSVALRRKRYIIQRPQQWRGLARTAGNVSLHSVGFWVLTTSPTWVASMALGENMLGQYTRAVVVASLPANALTIVFTRGLQPYYRYLITQESRQSALADISVLAVATAVPFFGYLAVFSEPMILILLGDGWNEAAWMAPVLACGFGTYLVFSILTNALETMKKFAAVRSVQIMMLLAAAVTGASVILTRSVQLAASMLLVVALVGICGVYVKLHQLDLLALRTHGWELVAQAAFSLLAVAAGFAAASGANLIVLPNASAQAALAVGVSSVTVAAVLLGAARFQPAYRLLVRRGVIRNSTGSSER
jgi:hypothetical protein